MRQRLATRGVSDMDNTQAAPEGSCDYKTVHVVTTYTSGNELRGHPVLFGKYPSDRDAKQALADAGFTNGEWGWRKGGYTDAEISSKVEYSNFRDTTQQATIDALTAKVAALEAACHAARTALDDVPDYHEEGMGCGLEDRNITDRYEAMAFGWEQAMERAYAEHVLPADEIIVAALGGTTN